MKARLCVEGSKEIRQYCWEREIPCEQVGTYVVAVEESQLPVLYDLKSRGEKNGVPGLEIQPSTPPTPYLPPPYPGLNFLVPRNQDSAGTQPR